MISEDRQTVAAVAHGDFDGETQMTGDKLVRGITVAVLAPTFGEVILLVSFEHLETPDVVEITFTASASNERWFTPCSNCEARELSLNAHFSRSVVRGWIYRLPLEDLSRLTK